MKMRIVTGLLVAVLSANSINADITRQATLAGNIAQVSGTLSNSLQNFRMP